MEDSCGPRKRKRASADVENPARSRDAEESVGNVCLPHLAMENIVKYLDFKDLLQWSLVNKFWNHEARRLLREKRQCALTVDLDNKSAKEVIEFKETLVAGELPLPYGSLSIKKKRQNTVPLVMFSKEVEDAQKAMKDIIVQDGPFEVVQLDVNCGSDISVESYMIFSVMPVVQKDVKVLMIKNSGGLDLLMDTRIRMKLLKLKYHIQNMEAAMQEQHKSLQNFFKCSEKLETAGCMSSNWIQFQLLKKSPPAGKPELVKEFSCVNMDISQEVAEFAELEPKLEKMFISRYRSSLLGPTNSISMSLLLSSQASLIELQAPYEMLQEVRRDRPSASFMNLRYLTVDLPLGMGREELDQDDTIFALFPMLETLEINT